MMGTDHHFVPPESDLLRLIARRQALIDELVERASRQPSPEIADALKLLASSGDELLERLTADRASLAEDLVRLRRRGAGQLTFLF
jgi:hypothetical protein